MLRGICALRGLKHDDFRRRPKCSCGATALFVPNLARRDGSATATIKFMLSTSGLVQINIAIGGLTADPVVLDLEIAMPAIDLHHLAIKTADVAATVSFWNEVLGSHSVERPDFGFPGAWLQFGTTMIHLYGGDAATNRDGGHDRGSAAIDHVAPEGARFR